MLDFVLGSVMSSIGFISIAVILWGFILVSIVFFVIGFVRRSWKALLYSGLAFIIPGIVLSTQGGLYLFILLYPIISILFAVVIKRRSGKH